MPEATSEGADPTGGSPPGIPTPAEQESDPRRRGSQWRRLTPLVRIGRMFTPLFAALAAMKLFRRRVDLGEMTLLVSALDMSVGRGLIRERVWERASTRAIRSILRRGDVVVDIGAHLGYFTVLASKCVGPDGAVYAFEPDPRTRKLLKANVEDNDAANVSIVAAAAGRTTGERRIRLNVAAPSVKARMLALDDDFEPGQAVDVVKIDIDGGEIDAFAGMARVLAESNGVHLLIEHDPWQQEAAGRSIAALHGTLRALGFEPLLAIDEATGEAKRVDWSSPDLADRTVNLLLVKSTALTGG